MYVIFGFNGLCATQACFRPCLHLWAWLEPIQASMGRLENFSNTTKLVSTLFA